MVHSLPRFMHSILANLHLPRGIGNASAKKARQRRLKKLSYAFLVTVCLQGDWVDFQDGNRLRSRYVSMGHDADGQC